jgi:hypothetical protein
MLAINCLCALVGAAAPTTPYEDYDICYTTVANIVKEKLVLMGACTVVISWLELVVSTKSAHTYNFARVTTSVHCSTLLFALSIIPVI